MSVLVQNCPLCGERRSDGFETMQSAGKERVYRICRNCGLVYQSPRMSDGELREHYASAYRESVQGTEAPIEKDLRIQAGRARALLGFCEGRLANAGRHLDVGCSAGKLLIEAAQEYGCASVGVEPGNAYREFCRRQGLRVVPDLHALEAMHADRFDLISLIHVLEHMPRPVEYLRDLRERWIEPLGHLLVEVPNLFEHASLEPAHLLAFTPGTLRQMLSAAGYEVEKMEAHGRPRSPILRLYITALARPAEATRGMTWKPSGPRGVRLHRRLGTIKRRVLSRIAPRLTWKELPEL